MKSILNKSRILLLLIVISFTYGCVKKKVFGIPDLKKENIRGKVVNINESYYQGIEIDGSIYKGEPLLIQLKNPYHARHITFDTSGCVYEIVNQGISTGVGYPILSTFTYEYDDYFRLISKSKDDKVIAIRKYNDGKKVYTLTRPFSKRQKDTIISYKYFLEEKSPISIFSIFPDSANMNFQKDYRGNWVSAIIKPKDGIIVLVEREIIYRDGVHTKDKSIIDVPKSLPEYSIQRNLNDINGTYFVFVKLEITNNSRFESSRGEKSVWISGILELPDFSEDTKYLTMDKVQENYFMLGHMDRVVTKRSCFSFSSYAEASAAREKMAGQ